MTLKFTLAPVLLALTTCACAQSDVAVYGIADAAVRHASGTTAVTGGMSQSRIGFKAAEDLGAGLSALAHLEHRFNLDNGERDADIPFWQLAYVGIKSNDWGRVTLGRQYNVLFDAATSTYASFKYSPYIEAFKPEMGFAFGARQDNMVKYAASAAGFTIEAQVSLENGPAYSGTAMGVPYSFSLPNKTRGGMARYEHSGIAVSAAYLEAEDSAGKKARASTAGASYSSGPWVVNASFARNRFDAGFGSVSSPVPAIAAAVQGQLLSRIVDSGTSGVAPVNLDHRDAVSVGATYAVTDAFNVGAQAWHIRQVGRTSAGDGRATMWAVVADYALSKRTDAYLEVDGTRMSDAMAFADGSKSRQGRMVGIRHRF